MVPPAEVGHEAPIDRSPGGHPLVNAPTPPSGSISAWVAIAAVPTMIAGIYGMNFTNIPELQASIDVGAHEYYYGYFVVLAVMAVVCVSLYRAFRRSGWL